MPTSQDIRWHQRLRNFDSALAQLTSAVGLAKQRELSALEMQGLIQAFEFTHELAWNVLKDYFEFQGASQITGSRDATHRSCYRPCGGDYGLSNVNDPDSDGRA